MQLYCLLVLMMLGGSAELLTIGAIVPFLTALSNPDLLWDKAWVQELCSSLGINSSQYLIFPLTILFSVSAIVAGLIRVGNVWCNGRLAAVIGSDLSCEAYKRTLYQSYEAFIISNSSDIITGIISQIQRTVSALNSVLQFITSLVISIFLLSALFYISPVVAFCALFIFGSAYIVLALTVRRELRSNGVKISSASKYQLKLLQEGLGSFRDVVLDGNQESYVKSYTNADISLRFFQAKNNFLSVFPRYAFESLGMVAISLLGSLIISQRGGADLVIPTLGALALGAQRLLPALQQMYVGWAQTKGYTSSIEHVLMMLNQPVKDQRHESRAYNFSNKIEFLNLCYKYSDDGQNVLNKINFEVRVGEIIGIIGGTGGGKSTILDLIMGLLTPKSGQILVDGRDLHNTSDEFLYDWRAAIAHVPQSIFLADASIAENIAFGVPKQDIDMERVREAAFKASISAFVETKKERYSTRVGERGIQLSGGQRQRIGIARALYKKSRVLILDEATSALDNGTEASIMQVIGNLADSYTIIMVAHRLSTIERCDRVIRLDRGQIVYDGIPENL